MLIESVYRVLLIFDFMSVFYQVFYYVVHIFDSFPHNLKF